MAADLFETYAVTIVATMVLSSIFLAGVPALLEDVIVYPLAIGGVCIIASIIGTFFVRLGASQNIMGALYKGFIVSAVLSLVGIRSEEHTSELQSLMRISYAVFCLKKKIHKLKKNIISLL